ncbi:hypothetical protein MMC24_004521 [Lignoscripta atroalba]|nr:hypothetical protein [Lignoscripta atroalba]
MLDAFWAAPPVSRTITAITFVESVLVHTNLVEMRRVVWFWPFVSKFPPELWRLVTAFTLSGPQVGILLDPYNLWTYGTALENDSPRFNNSGDFLVYILFVGSVILGLGWGVLGAFRFTPALILALMYTYSQVNRGKKIKFFVVSFDAKYLPYVTLFLTWILESPQAMILQAVGIPAAHLYDFLTLLWPTFGGGKNIVQTPSFLARWFGSDRSVPHSITKRYGTAIRPVDQPPRASSSGFGSSLSGIWGNRGQGRRLGGD